MSKTIILPEAVYLTLIDTAHKHIEDIESGIGEGIYEDNEDNAQMLQAMRTAVNYKPPAALNVAYNLANSGSVPESPFPSYPFTDIEVHPCVQDEDGHVRQCEADERPDFYSVYIRYAPNGNQEEFGGLDCIADFNSEDEATGFKNMLENLVCKYSPPRELLREAVKFLNAVPNKQYGNNYEIASRIDAFLKS